MITEMNGCAYAGGSTPEITGDGGAPGVSRRSLRTLRPPTDLRTDTADRQTIKRFVGMQYYVLYIYIFIHLER